MFAICFLHCLVNKAIFGPAQVTKAAAMEWSAAFRRVTPRNGGRGRWQCIKKIKKTEYPFVHGDNKKGSTPGNHKYI